MALRRIDWDLFNYPVITYLWNCFFCWPSVTNNNIYGFTSISKYPLFWHSACLKLWEKRGNFMCQLKLCSSKVYEMVLEMTNQWYHETFITLSTQNMDLENSLNRKKKIYLLHRIQMGLHIIIMCHSASTLHFSSYKFQFWKKKMKETISCLCLWVL